MINKTCGACALMKLAGGTCPIFREPIGPQEPACPRFKRELNNCDMCGQPILGEEIIYLNPNNQTQIRVYCEQCSNQIGKCPTCENANSCDFQTNTSNIPPIIQQQIRQGNAVMMTQVKNPERIEITCKKNCKCFDSEYGCMKEEGFCFHWKPRKP